MGAILLLATGQGAMSRPGTLHCKMPPDRRVPAIAEPARVDSSGDTNLAHRRRRAAVRARSSALASRRCLLASQRARAIIMSKPSE